MRVFATLVLAILSLAARADAQPATVELVMRVHVRTESGVPIADVPIQLTSGFGIPLKRSDELGNVEFRFQREPLAFPLGAGFSDGAVAPVPAEESLLAGQRFLTLRAQHAFPPVAFHSVPASAAEFDIEIVANAAVKAKGRVLGSSRLPIQAGAVFARTYSSTDAGGDGRFECVSIPKGKVGKLILFIEGGQVWLKTVPSAQLMNDVDLGDITLELASANASVRLRALASTGVFDSDMSLVSNGVTLVHQSGEVIYSFEVDQIHRAVGFGGVPIDPAQRPDVLAGSYYVAPGEIGNAPSLKLIDLVRANRVSELNAAGVPKFVATANQTIEYAFDMATGLAAIQNIPDEPPVGNPPQPPASPGP